MTKEELNNKIADIIDETEHEWHTEFESIKSLIKEVIIAVTPSRYEYDDNELQGHEYVRAREDFNDEIEQATKDLLD